MTEVVFGGASRTRSFMCGALSERLDTSMELDFAVSLMNELVRDLPPERIGMHICRGNWSADESVALSGDYAPLIDTLNRVNVGVLFLELATGRAGRSAVLRSLDGDKRIAVGVANQKLDSVEPVEAVSQRIAAAIDLFGRERVLLTPDCGFATFADNPVASSTIAEAKLKAIVEARNLTAAV